MPSSSRECSTRCLRPTRFQACRDAKQVLLQKSLKEQLADDALEKARRLKSLPGPPPRWLDACGCVGDGCAVAACLDW